MDSGSANAGQRPGAAAYAVVLMIAAGAIALGLSVYWMFWGGRVVGGVLNLVLGFAYLYGGRALYRGDSSGWGAGVFAGGLFILFGLFLLPFSAILIALAVAVIVLLYRARGYFGMVRHDPEEEERRKKAFETERTSNPTGFHCPRCGSNLLWVAPDNSAYCLACKAGTIALTPVA